MTSYWSGAVAVCLLLTASEAPCRAADDAARLLPHRQRQAGAVQRRPRRHRAARLARQSRPRRSTNQPRQVFLRSQRSAVAARPLLARLRFDLRRVGNDRRSQAMNRTFHESLRFPAPDGPVQIVLKKRDAQNAFQRNLDHRRRSQRTCSSIDRAASRDALIAIEKNGAPADKVDFLILGDGYTAAERGKFEQDARRLVEILFADVALQGAPERLQRVGPRAGRRRVAASRGPRPASTARRRWARPTTRSAPSATSSPSTTGAARHARVRAVRVHRDPHQQRHLRRWRHLQPVSTHRRRRQPRRPTSSSTSSGTTSRALADEYYTSAVA